LHFTGDLGFSTTPNAEQSAHEVRQLFTRQEAVLSTGASRTISASMESRGGKAQRLAEASQRRDGRDVE